MGTPEFARKPLAALATSAHSIAAVVTGPDSRSPRGGKYVPTPVCQEAEKWGMPVIKVDSLKDDAFYEELKSVQADIIVVVAFKILPERVFTLPPKGAINIHASLLPKYRGAAPINWALINGEKETGLTSFILKKKVDTGDIILQEKVPIFDDDTYDSLSARLSELAGPFLLRTLELVESGRAVPRVQNDEIATPAPKIRPFDALIDFGFPAEKVHNFIRGLSSYPGAYTYFRGERVKVLSSALLPSESDGSDDAVPPGTILPSRKKLIVQCAHSALEIRTLVPQGKKPMSGVSFLNGYKPQPGEQFGTIPKGGNVHE